MLINEHNFPISPRHIKQKTAGQLEHLVQATLKAASNPKHLKKTNKEDKLARAVPGFKNARDSQIGKRESGIDVLEGTQSRVRENGETSPPKGKRPVEGREVEVILLLSPQKVTEGDFEEKGAKKAYLKKKGPPKPHQEETRNHLGLLVSS